MDIFLLAGVRICVQCLVILENLVKTIHGGDSFRKFGEISVRYASALSNLRNVAINVNDQFERYQSYSLSPVDDRVRKSQGVWQFYISLIAN